eukprot:4751078-Pleurochrysis_carterae.AAC.1
MDNIVKTSTQGPHFEQLQARARKSGLIQDRLKYLSYRLSCKKKLQMSIVANASGKQAIFGQILPSSALDETSFGNALC